MSKYKSTKIFYLGELFDSKAELSRYHELKILEKAGKIKNLQRQVPFELIPKQKGERAVTYKADFAFDCNGVKVVEDVKGYQTPEYKLKRKLFKKCYPDYEFSEIYKGEPTKNSTFTIK